LQRRDAYLETVILTQRKEHVMWRWTRVFALAVVLGVSVGCPPERPVIRQPEDATPAETLIEPPVPEEPDEAQPNEFEEGDEAGSP
jgi:hypothetical protein